MAHEWFSELWTAAKQAGPFASMFLLLMLYLVNEERKAMHRRYDTLVERVLSGLNSATDSIKELKEVHLTSRGRYDAMVDRVLDAITSLKESSAARRK
jgi:hypothetical protein